MVHTGDGLLSFPAAHEEIRAAHAPSTILHVVLRMWYNYPRRARRSLRSLNWTGGGKTVELRSRSRLRVRLLTLARAPSAVSLLPSAHRWAKSHQRLVALNRRVQRVPKALKLGPSRRTKYALHKCDNGSAASWYDECTGRPELYVSSCGCLEESLLT